MSFGNTYTGQALPRLIYAAMRFFAYALILLVAGMLCLPQGARAETVSSGRESLIDTYMAGYDQSQGVAVAVSVGVEVQVRKDYGYADTSGTALSSEYAFEWGRVSDLIVWASVMQLVESHQISLTESILTYLPASVELPEDYESLDLLDLMNHTSGLDIDLSGSRSSVADGCTDAAAALNLFSVKAGFDPGSVVGYTPYDALLGALVVQTVSGMNFVDYVNENIFARLGMENTYLMVAGDAARFCAANDLSCTLASGSSGSSSISSPRSTTSSVFTCFGTVDDLLLFAQGLMCASDDIRLFDEDSTADSMFSVTRTYPSLGTARFAHGMFSFPFTATVFGESGTTTSGFTCSLYMDYSSGLAIAIMVNQSGRADLTQGISRILVGRDELSVENSSSPENAVWIGTYQSAGSVNQGPSKLLTALDRVVVSTNDQGVLIIDGVTATSLGAGVYSQDSLDDQDVYRFHVSLERGNEFSRVDEDYYVVSAYTLAVERYLLGSLVIAELCCVGYCMYSSVELIRSALRRRSARLQNATFFLSALTVLAALFAAYGLYRLSEGMAPVALDALLIVEALYCVLAFFSIVWLLVTRWRGSYWTGGQNIVSALIVFSSIALMLNLVYWELLP